MLTVPDTIPQDAAGAADHHGAGGPAVDLSDPAAVQVAILSELVALNGKIDFVAGLAVDGLHLADQFRPVIESIVAGLAGHPLLSRLIRL